ncbi:hypothetical protein N431DRAFT_419663 [Stipitochalara longipes BDJ]|nr:hypothetical protein N431DRAFT_419663 [Stipitochalara longipes BDJ]
MPNTETSDKPWQLENKARALKLVRYASKCRKENRNEAGWRSEIEFRLFERFDIEVACKRCRKRLWRSEIEANPTSSNSRTTSLVERQQQRVLCQCNPSGRLDDFLDPGLSDLFSSRIQEAVCQLGEDDLQTPNPKKEPDRIHGLRKTTIFEKYLQEVYCHEESENCIPRLIEEVLQVSINPDNGGEPLLFPFLILEAKGEKGAENFEHMEIQTSFPIKNALKLQYDLLKTRGNTMDVPGGPLVWFFASRGEDWRVYGAFVHEQDGRPDYWIQHLWSGSVTGYDGALQLILIVDHILDWARDIYRPNIIRQLKMLCSSNMNDAMTLGFDPDVYSLAGEVQPWMAEVEAQTFDLMPEDVLSPPRSDIASVTHDEEQTDPLAMFKTPHGIVRDGRFIESRVRALLLTGDNASTFFEDFDNPKKAQTFARSILAALNRRCVVLDNEEVLNAIEEKWTGTVQSRTGLARKESCVYAQFRVSYYLNHAWGQVRELTYLAASEDAREILIEKADFRKVVSRRSRFSPPKCSTEDMLGTIDRFLQRSVRRDFMAALTRSTFMLDMKSTGLYPPSRLNPQSDFEDFMPTSAAAIFKMVLKVDKDKKSPGVAMQELVHAVYEKYRIGKREPCEPFLRISSRVDMEDRPLWKGWKAGDEISKKVEHLDKVLVYADVMNAPFLPKDSDQKLCMFVLDGKAVTAPFDITTKLLKFLHRHKIYGTVRKGRVYKTRINWMDNRVGLFFDMDKAEESLKVSAVELRRGIFEWIRMLNPHSEPSLTEA